MEANQLKSEFRDAIENEFPHEPYSLSARACTSDRFSGVEYVIEGGYIPIDAILEVLREHDHLFAESIAAAPEGDGSRLVIFVVEADLNPAGSATYKEMQSDV